MSEITYCNNNDLKFQLLLKSIFLYFKTEVDVLSENLILNRLKMHYLKKKIVNLPSVRVRASKPTCF